MEHELGFPNPVKRTDLPRKRRRWPKILAAVVLVLILFVVFLPQLLRTGPGKSFVVARIQKATWLRAWVRDIETSWFGPTTITDLWLSDQKGAKLGFKSFTCDVSLWQWLTSSQWNLGQAQAHDPFLNYVVDRGDGKDLFDAMGKPLPPGAKPPPPQPWRWHGRIEIRNGTFCVTRGQVLSTPGYPSVFQTVVSGGINGFVDMPGPRQTWSCELSGVVAGSAEEPPGTCRLSGSVVLGPFASFADPSASGQLKLELRQVPTVQRRGSGNKIESHCLLWVINPDLQAQDYEKMFGPVLSAIDAHAVVENGAMRFERFVIAAAETGGRAAVLEGQPVIDWAAKPPTIKQGARPLRLAVNISPGLGQSYLGYINPFLSDAVSGWAELTFAQLSLPVGRGNVAPQIAGELRLSDLQLQVDDTWYAGRTPASLTGQWAWLMNDPQRQLAAQLAPLPFKSDNRFVKPDAHSMTIGGQSLSLSGHTAPAGRLKMILRQTLPPELATKLSQTGADLQVPLTGTISKPEMSLSASSAKMEELLRTHLEAQHERHLERMRQQSTEDLGVLRPATGPASP